MILSKKETLQFAAAMAGTIKRDTQNIEMFSQAPYYNNYGLNKITEVQESRQRRDFRSIFFKCLEMRATAFSEAMSNAYVEREIGQNEFEAVEYTHPWYQLLRNPSTFWTAGDVWEWAHLSIDLQGNADFIVEVNSRGIPIQLLPVFDEFGKLIPAPSAQGGISHYLFYRSDGQIRRIDSRYVVRLDRKSPFSPYEPFSLIQAARYDLDSNDAMKRYRAGSVEHGGITSPVLLTDKDLSDSQHRQLQNEYKQFVGTRGLEPGKVAVFGSGSKPWTPQTMRDLEYIEGSIHTDKTIMMICGVPPGMFEAATTRATAEAALVTFTQMTVSKIVKKGAQQITHQFENAFAADKGVLHVIPPDVVPLDKDFILRQREVYLRTGQRTINDYLKEDGYEDDPNAGRRYIPLGWMPIDQDRFGTNPQPPERVMSKRAVSRELDTEEKRTAAWRAVDATKTRQSELLKPVLGEWFEDIQKQIMKSIEDYEPKRDFSLNVFDINAAEYELLQKLAPEIIRILAKGHDYALSSVNVTGLEFSINQPSVQNAIKAILEKQATVPATLFDNAVRVIQKAVEEKKSRREVGQLVAEFFDGYAPGKIQNIANGLTTTTFETGQEIAYSEAGVTETEWLSSRDGSVRPTHDEADGRRAAIGETFQVGNAQLRYPGDSDGPEEEVIGCRCTRIATRMSDEL